ncbi:hypothetical protein QM416_04725 [Streptococcus oralis subsp. tigurinus]|uniref:hypothetical protein n=1 Tax=Streptococcus oralis TaxID=1303 RepID=UPI0039C0763F
MTKFVQLVPLKYGEVKEPITINIDCIKSVLKHDIYLSKVFVSDDLIEHLKEQLTADKFLYVIKPTYEEITAILTQKEQKE